MAPWNLDEMNGHVVLDVKPDFGVDTVFVLHRLSSYALGTNHDKEVGSAWVS